jgi:hypothetical protein
MNVYDKIVNGDYRTKLAWPDRLRKPIPPRNHNQTVERVETYLQEMKDYEANKPAHQSAIKAYEDDQRRLDEQFKADAIADIFGEDAPYWPTVIEKIWLIAYEHGHSSGQGEVYNYLQDYSDIIDAIKEDLRDAN